MVRKLKYHEQKLLKKVDFISWKTDSNVREVKILRRYHIQRRDDYTKYETTIVLLRYICMYINRLPGLMCVCRYNKLSGMVKSLASKIKELDPKDPYRNKVTTELLEKL